MKYFLMKQLSFRPKDCAFSARSGEISSAMKIAGEFITDEISLPTAVGTDRNHRDSAQDDKE
jgi:hypothetical protein